MAAPVEPTQPVASECAVMAEHVAGVLLTFPKPPKASKEALADLIKTRCETDGWSADAKKCWGAMSNQEDAKPCAKLLTTEQHDAIMADARKLDPDHAPDHAKDKGSKLQLEEGKMGKGDGPRHGGHDSRYGEPAPAPTTVKPAQAPPPPPKPARKPAPSKGDPCGGGE